MPLSEDSRALLQLLLGRGKSYSEISDLLGIEPAEVRQRAVTALTEVEPSLPAPDPDVTDYLLGQSDAISRADIRTRIASDPALAAQADSLTDQLRLLVPGADLPDPASAGGGKPRAATPAAAPASSAGSSAPATTSGSAGEAKTGLASITSHQQRLIAVLLGGALLATVLILLLTGVIGGGDDSGDDQPTPQAAQTVAVLQPVGNEKGSGQIQFGFAGTSFAANVQISGLEPSKKGQGYVFWLYGSTGAFPFHTSTVDKSGAISGQIPNLNEAMICLVASDVFPTVRVSRANDKDFNAALDAARAKKGQNAALPKYTGKTVLEGPISMPQEAKDTIIPICNGTAQGS